MGEFVKFIVESNRSVRVALIAISIIILQDWISTDTPDILSRVSLIAISVSLPFLVFELLLFQMPELHYPNKIFKYISRINRILGEMLAAVGIVTAIWHASWIAGAAFLICGLYSSFIYVLIFESTRNSLQKEAKRSSK